MCSTPGTGPSRLSAAAMTHTLRYALSEVPGSDCASQADMSDSAASLAITRRRSSASLLT
jgi:hypothetical protein